MANLSAGDLQIGIEVNTNEIDKLKAKLNGLEGQTKKNNLGIGKLAASFGVAKLAIGAATKALNAAGQTIKKGINLARDLEESNNKLRVTFRGIEDDATKARDALVSAYGLSRNEATDLLGATGDLLTGFGFQRKEALKLSESVQQLAVDLASFQNLEGGAERASQALTKALLGETESAKALGIVIRQNTPEFIEQVKTLMETEGVTQQVAKAQVIYQQAVTQSANAIGDFERTSESLANRQRRLQAVQDDIAANLGRAFLPALKSITGEFLNSAEGIRDFTKEGEGLTKIQKTISFISATIFALGKIISINLKILNAFNLLIIAVNRAFLELIKPLDFIVDGFKKLASGAVEAGKKIIDNVGNAIDKVIGKAGELGNKLGIEVPDNVSNALDVLEEAGKNFVTSIGDDFKDIGGVFDRFLKEQEDALTKAEDNLNKSGQKIRSAQEILTEFAKDSWQGWVESAAQAFTNVSGIVTNFLEADLERYVQNEERKIEALDERLAREIELIENNGMTKQEALNAELAAIQEKLILETDATKKKDLEEQKSEIQKQIAIQQATNRIEKQRNELDKKLAKEKYKREVEIFNVKKATDIVNATVTAALGIVSAWTAAASAASQAGIAAPAVFATVGGVLTGVIGTVLATQIGLIASKQPPPPPKFAQGGIASSAFIAGEQGQELIVPEGVSNRTRVFNARDTKAIQNQVPMVNATFIIGDEEVPINRAIITNRQRAGVII